MKHRPIPTPNRLDLMMMLARASMIENSIILYIFFFVAHLPGLHVSGSLKEMLSVTHSASLDIFSPPFFVIVL